MAESTFSTEAQPLMWPDDIQKRRGPILLFWIACQWFCLVMGTVGVVIAYSAPRTSGMLSSGTFQDVLLGALLMLFSFSWATVTYFACHQRLWAFRAGICFSVVGFVGLAVALAVPIYQLGNIKEVWALVSCLTILITRSIQIGNEKNEARGSTLITCYVIEAACTLILFWRLAVSPNSPELRSAMINLLVLTGLLQVLRPYASTCRNLVRGSIDS
ncbi:hypothetical protein [Schlesneria paludicola]|uniref:hypothetical protein n=1 Tax=Schlesneria paludicola TaxID=360056 RepID=UPI00029AB310|nr:hypothetical protein [Schlesneria paludicola]